MAAGERDRLNAYSLASRLSYFLWSTMPDDELFGLARRGELRRGLPAQIGRMLKDTKAQAFVRNFTGQWLQARDVEFVPINARVVLGPDAGFIRRNLIGFAGYSGVVLGRPASLDADGWTIQSNEFRSNGKANPAFDGIDIGFRPGQFAGVELLISYLIMHVRVLGIVQNVVFVACQCRGIVAHPSIRVGHVDDGEVVVGFEFERARKIREGKPE